MADSLLLRLPHDAQRQATWLLVGANGASAPESGPLRLAAARASGRPLIVLAPGADVLLTQAQLPPARSSLKRQQLVPYALEEQLAEDIDTLHFAIGRTSEGRTPVAVVARKRMDAWLAELRAAGLEPAALYAESELLPRNPTQAVALLEHDSVTVRTPSAGVVILSAEALDAALELALEEQTPRGLILYTGAPEWQRYGARVEALRERFESLQVQRLSGDALALFARALPAPEAINLLQGPYAPSHALVSGWRAWRWAAVLLAALIGVYLVGQGIELAMLHRRARALDASIQQVFHKAMPKEQMPYQPRRRMAQRLAEVRAGEARGGFLDALGALAEARAGASNVHFNALDFHAGTVTLTLSAPSVEVLNRLTQALEHQGWQAHLTGTNTVHGHVEGGIRMRRRS